MYHVNILSTICSLFFSLNYSFHYFLKICPALSFLTCVNSSSPRIDAWAASAICCPISRSLYFSSSLIIWLCSIYRTSSSFTPAPPASIRALCCFESYRASEPPSSFGLNDKLPLLISSFSCILKILVKNLAWVPPVSSAYLYS
jgi:hypothetical protein